MRNWYAFILVGCFIYFSACKKENPNPSVNNALTNGNTSPNHSAGSVSGTVTVDSSAAVTLTGAIVGTSNYVISASSTASSYPQVDIAFASKPTKNGNYSLNSLKGGPILSVVTSSNAQDQYFADTSSSINVVVNNGQLTINFSKVKFLNANNASHNASGTLIVY